MMEIRKSTSLDTSTIMELINQGRKKMAAEGNIHQWTDGHPSQETIENDIRLHNSYLVLSDDGTPVATFALIEGPDPTYTIIYDGAWLNDNPYYVIHRVASAQGVHGVMRMILDHAMALTKTIRIDTHRDNRTMQGALLRYGFRYCGIIHLANGDERMAFQLDLKDNDIKP